jgi:hypothetical protein|tara:strand:+ start:1265 stop:1903 length:639 start_codon:yes stop_codon:yes gene_type:complete
MKPMKHRSADQAVWLAVNLDAVLRRMESTPSSRMLDDLLRAYDLGERLGRLDPEVTHPVRAVLGVWKRVRSRAIEAIQELVSEDSWDALDRIGDKLMVGEMLEEAGHWAMMALRIANVLEHLPEPSRTSAIGTLRRVVDCLHMAPGHLLSLTQHAAGLIEYEDLDRQPEVVQQLINQMVGLPLWLEEEKRLLAEGGREVFLMEHLCQGGADA